MEDTQKSCPFCQASFLAEELKNHIAKDHFFGIKPQVEERPKIPSPKKPADEIVNEKKLPPKESPGNLDTLPDTALKIHGFGKENKVVSVVQEDPETVFIVIESPKSEENEVQDSPDSPHRTQCKICSRIFSSTSSLITHRKIQHEGYRFECTHCKKQYKSYNHGHKRCSDGTPVTKPLALKKCLSENVLSLVFIQMKTF